MAIAFASVGPCFMEPLLGDDTFADQMVYLHEAGERYPVLVLEVQQILLDWHAIGQHGIGRGITAMPSMHVALATIFWLATRRIYRWAGWFFFVFLAVIFVGSIHLAYHYAVDGIVAFVGAILIWIVAGRLTSLSRH